MAQINVTDLTFSYEESFDNIFDQVSFSIDSNWKLGFIGRNGKGKTTFLNILRGKYEYSGSIATSLIFDYFPYEIKTGKDKIPAAELMEEWKQGCELWRVLCEMEKLQISSEVLYRPFGTLSQGEQTKLMLAILFSGEHEFLLIDEPTNHLDQEARATVKDYLAGKKGYILVSHDRDLLDACVDHVLVLNRKTIEVQSGNFSSWWENKQRKDNFSLMENEKHLREIKSLRKAVDQSRRWAEKNENSKIGFDPAREPDRCIGTRSYIGAKTKKMQSRVAQFEHRMDREIEEKEGLLQDIEKTVDLKIHPLHFHKDLLVDGKDIILWYGDSDKKILDHLDFQLYQGERVFLHGKNGCGKSSLIKAILVANGMNASEQARNSKNAAEQGNGVISAGEQEQSSINAGEQGHIAKIELNGSLWVGAGIKISYVSQDTSQLRGSIKDYCKDNNLEEQLFCALLRQLDMERIQFTKSMETYSEGQKKKVLLATSLMTPAHIYIWDEPLNYIDVFSRMQIENLILEYKPTMILVDHDIRFREKVATRVMELNSCE